jgi:hypothetical protein
MVASMSRLTELFEQGRQNERDHARKQKIRRTRVRQGQKSSFSPVNIVVGAGVVYEIAYPYLSTVRRYFRIFDPVILTIKWDLRHITKKIFKDDQNFEDYKMFCELARRK